MKPIFNLLIIAVLSASVCSCKKLGDTTVSGNNSLLVGTWSLVNDTTSMGFWGLWASKPSTGSNYIGKAADHYTFTANGYMYTSEAGEADSATYMQPNSSTIEVNYYSFNGVSSPANIGNFTIKNLTAHTLTLVGDTAISPETISSHIRNFKR